LRDDDCAAVVLVGAVVVTPYLGYVLLKPTHQAADEDATYHTPFYGASGLRDLGV